MQNECFIIVVVVFSRSISKILLHDITKNNNRLPLCLQMFSRARFYFFFKFGGIFVVLLNRKKHGMTSLKKTKSRHL